jgi:hypothetical protein
MSEEEKKETSEAELKAEDLKQVSGGAIRNPASPFGAGKDASFKVEIEGVTQGVYKKG